MKVTTVPKQSLLAHLNRQRQMVENSQLGAEQRERALGLVDRDIAILESARGDTVEEMRAHHKFARDLTDWSAIAVGGGIAVSAGLTLMDAIPAKAFVGSVAGMAVLGIAAMATASFVIQAPVVNELLNSMRDRIEPLASAEQNARDQVGRLTESLSQEEEVSFSEDGLQIGDFFLPSERDDKPFHF